jgi:hypothetical protein
MTEFSLALDRAGAARFGGSTNTDPAVTLALGVIWDMVSILGRGNSAQLILRDTGVITVHERSGQSWTEPVDGVTIMRIEGDYTQREIVDGLINLTRFAPDTLRSVDCDVFGIFFGDPQATHHD